MSIKENIECEKNSNPINDFVTVFACEEDLHAFFKIKSEVILAADATHDVCRKSDLKLFSVCTFDSFLNRTNLVSMLTGSEKEETS